VTGQIHKIIVVVAPASTGGQKRVRLRCPVPDCVVGFISGDTETVDGVIELLRAKHAEVQP
jgi:hypothetical protein